MSMLSEYIGSQVVGICQDVAYETELVTGILNHNGEQYTIDGRLATYVILEGAVYDGELGEENLSPAILLHEG